MRHIVRVLTIHDYELVVGEWEPIEYTDRSVVDECATLEEALERLALYNSNKTKDESYHIGYDDVALNLEDWEEEWLIQCSLDERRERKAELQARRDMMLPDFSEFRDDLYDEYPEIDADYEEEYNATYNDSYED